MTTFVLGILMLNIFIGVVGESYNNAFARRDRLFVKERSRIVFDYAAIHYGRRWLFRTCGSGADEYLDSGKDFLWYCRERDSDPLFIDDDAELDAGQQRILAEVSTQGELHGKRLARVEDSIEKVARHLGLLVQALGDKNRVGIGEGTAIA